MGGRCLWDPPLQELPGLRAGGSAAGPTAPSPGPCSTLPDSPPDSGSEAYSPQQVNGEFSGRCHPPPLGLGKWLGLVGAALSGEGGRRTGGGQRLPNGARLSLVKYSLALAIVSARAGGEPGPASEQVSLLVMPPPGRLRHHGRALRG